MTGKDELDYPAVALYALQHCVSHPELNRTQVFTWIKTNWNNFAVVDKRSLLQYVQDLFYNTKLIQLGHDKKSLIEFMELWTWIQKELSENEGLFDIKDLKGE